MDKIIEVKGLVKNYGSVKAVRNIDFYVEAGKLFAFLGPNGAGKTTTINIICTLLDMDAGEILVDGLAVGRDDQKIRDRIGIVFQESVLDPLLTVRENLLTRGSIYGLGRDELEKNVATAMKVTSIGDLADRRYGKLSGGQRRRCDIARALVHRPRILFLDEPTTGLDPQTRKNVWDMIELLRLEEKMTIFLTTHYMEEAEKADFVIVIDDGVIAAKGTPAELKDRHSSDRLEIKPVDRAKALSDLTAAGVAFTEQADLIVVTLRATVEALPILGILAGNVAGFQVLNGTMDDAFIGITGKEIRA
ncbi:MAG: ATP-binding cassette domain-containing protein [Candidatus Izemoplasmatales bacterium]